MSQIKAIQTEYKGYKFRSRLEARWAVFFDAAGIEYEYEPEGFLINNGLCYLPDFYLPNVYSRSKYPGLWVEVKGIMSDADRKKIETFASLVKNTAVLYKCNQYSSDNEILTGGGGFCAWDNCGTFWRCPKCGTVIYEFYNGEARCQKCGCNNAPTEYFEYAYKKAKQARFEYGESPD